MKYFALVFLVVPGVLAACSIGQYATVEIGEVNYQKASAEYSVCQIGFSKNAFSVTYNLYLKGIRITRNQVFDPGHSPELPPDQIEAVKRATFLSLPLGYQVELPALKSEDYWKTAFIAPLGVSLEKNNEPPPFTVKIGDGTAGHTWGAELAQSDGKILKVKNDGKAQELVRWIFTVCGVHYFEARSR